MSEPPYILLCSNGLNTFTNSHDFNRYATLFEGLKMKKITKLSANRKAVANVIASLRIEQLKPSQAVVTSLHNCVAGTDTTQHVLEGVIKRHVTLRRV